MFEKSTKNIIGNIFSMNIKLIVTFTNTDKDIHTVLCKIT